MSSSCHIRVTLTALSVLALSLPASAQLIGVCPSDLCPPGTVCSGCDYDEAGRLDAVTIESCGTADCSATLMGERPAERRTYVYDGDGLLREAMHDSDLDGAANLVCSFEPGCPPPYDQCEPECHTQFLWADGIGQACPLEASCYYARCACDAEGRVLVDVDETTVRGRAREVERREYAYDEQGRRQQVRVYIGGGSAIAWSERYVYDAGGDLVREELDRGGDGWIDQVRTFAYDPRGRILVETLDNDNDGVVDQRWTYHYEASDAAGGTFTVELDRGDNGTIDSIETYRWNGSGLPTLWEQDADLDGQPDARAAYTYDDRGRELSHEQEERIASSWSHRVTRFEYDDIGRRTMAVVDTDADGAIEQVCQYAPPCPPPYRGEVCRRACAPAAN